jgi:hypothetical protein
MPLAYFLLSYLVSACPACFLLVVLSLALLKAPPETRSPTIIASILRAQLPRSTSGDAFPNHHREHSVSTVGSLSLSFRAGKKHRQILLSHNAAFPLHNPSPYCRVWIQSYLRSDGRWLRHAGGLVGWECFLLFNPAPTLGKGNANET